MIFSAPACAKRMFNPRYPLLLGAVACLASVLGGMLPAWPFAVAGGVTAVSVTVFFAFRAKPENKWVPIAALLLAAGFFFYAGAKAFFLQQNAKKVNNGTYYITGVVQRVENKDTRTVLLLSEAQIYQEGSSQPVLGLQLTLYDALRRFEPGQVLEAVGNVRPVAGPRNPGEQDFTRFYYAQGVSALATANEEDVSLMGATVHLNAPFFKLKENLTDVLFRYSSGNNAAFLSSLLFGGTELLEPDTVNSFTLLGISHLIAVSGLQIALLGYAFSWLLGVCKVGRRLRFLLTAAFLLGYSAMCAFTPSVLRACVMFLIVLYASFSGRRYDIYNGLGIACALLLAINPLSVFLLGFQLSFLACVGIAWGTRWFSRVKARAPRALLGTVGITAGAQLGTLPITLQLSGFYTPVSFFANLLFVPLSTLLLYVALVGVLLAALVPAAGGPLLGLAGWGADLFLQAVNGVSAWSVKPFLLPMLPASLIAAYYLLFSFCLPLLLRPFWKKLLAAMAVAALLLAIPFSRSAQEQGFTVVYLSVGQADCAYVETPAGEKYLVDTGTSATAGYYAHSAQQVLLPFLRFRGVTRLDGVFISHEHADHAGGLLDLLGQVEVENIYCSAAALQNNNFAAITALYSLGGTKIVPLNQNSRVQGKDYLFTVLSAPAAAENEGSVVLRLEAYSRILVFMGDAMPQAVVQIPEQCLQADIMTAPHHGLKSGFSLTLQQTLPGAWLLSADLDTKTVYGSQTQPVYNTSLHGAVLVRITQQDMNIQSWAIKPVWP